MASYIISGEDFLKFVEIIKTGESSIANENDQMIFNKGFYALSEYINSIISKTLKKAEVYEQFAQDCFQSCWSFFLEKLRFTFDPSKGEQEKDAFERFKSYAYNYFVETCRKESNDTSFYPYTRLKTHFYIKKVRQELYKRNGVEPSLDGLLSELKTNSEFANWTIEKLSVVETEMQKMKYYDIAPEIDSTSSDDELHHNILDDEVNPYNLESELFDTWEFFGDIYDINANLKRMNLPTLNDLDIRILECIRDNNELAEMHRVRRLVELKNKELLIESILCSEDCSLSKYSRESLNEQINPERLESIALKQYLGGRGEEEDNCKKEFYQSLNQLLVSKGYNLKEQKGDILSIIKKIDTFNCNIERPRRQIIAFSLNNHLDVGTANELLQYFGQDKLYARNIYDACMIYALNQKLSLSDYTLLYKEAKSFINEDSPLLPNIESEGHIDNERVSKWIEYLNEREKRLGGYGEDGSSLTITKKLHNAIINNKMERDEFIQFVADNKEHFSVCRERTHRIILQAYQKYCEACPENTIRSICIQMNRYYGCVWTSGIETNRTVLNNLEKNMRTLFEFSGELPITRTFFLMAVMFFMNNRGYHPEMINKMLSDAGFLALNMENNYIDKSIMRLSRRNVSESEKRANRYRLNQDLDKPFTAAVEFMKYKESKLKGSVKERYLE